MTTICLAEPGCYRNMHNMVQSMSGGSGRVEVIALAATDEGDTGSQYAAQSAADRQSHQPTASSNGTASDNARYVTAGALPWLQLIRQAHDAYGLSTARNPGTGCRSRGRQQHVKCHWQHLNPMYNSLLEFSVVRDGWSRMNKHSHLTSCSDCMHACMHASFSPCACLMNMSIDLNMPSWERRHFQEPSALYSFVLRRGTDPCSLSISRLVF